MILKLDLRTRYHYGCSDYCIKDFPITLEGKMSFVGSGINDFNRHSFSKFSRNWCEKMTSTATTKSRPNGSNPAPATKTGRSYDLSFFYPTVSPEP